MAGDPASDKGMGAWVARFHHETPDWMDSKEVQQLTEQDYIMDPKMRTELSLPASTGAQWWEGSLLTLSRAAESLKGGTPYPLLQNTVDKAADGQSWVGIAQGAEFARSLQLEPKVTIAIPTPTGKVTFKEAKLRIAKWFNLTYEPAKPWLVANDTYSRELSSRLTLVRYARMMEFNDSDLTRRIGFMLAPFLSQVTLKSKYHIYAMRLFERMARTPIRVMTPSDYDMVMRTAWSVYIALTDNFSAIEPGSLDWYVDPRYEALRHIADESPALQ